MIPEGRSCKVALSGQLFHRLPLPLHVVALAIVEDLPSPSCGFSRDLYHLISLDLEPVKSCVGFSLISVSSARRAPIPPARIVTFIGPPSKMPVLASATSGWTLDGPVAVSGSASDAAVRSASWSQGMHCGSVKITSTCRPQYSSSETGWP
jgi:hypothetical protein